MPEAPRFMKCPVCEGTDTLNVNVRAAEPVDLCVRCGTDIHSAAVWYGAGCPTCGACFCYCEAKAGWKKQEVARG
jgi:hypothetical protein